MGWVVSIPVFCDSGFVVLNPIRKALVKRTGTSSVAMTVCLASGNSAVAINYGDGYSGDTRSPHGCPEQMREGSQ